MALLFWYVVLSATNAVSGVWGAFDLWSFRLFGLLFAASWAGGLADVARRRGQGRMLALLPYATGSLLLLSSVYTYLHRVDGRFDLAEGEAFQPVPAAFSKLSMGPLAKIPSLPLVLADVAPAGKAGCAALVRSGAKMQFSEEFQDLDGTRLRFVNKGVVPMISITAQNGSLIEESYVKLDLATPLGQDSFMFSIIPYEFILKRADSADGRVDAFRVDVRSGKLRIAEGVLASGGTLKIRDATMTLKDVRRSAVFELQGRPGLRAVYLSWGLFALALGSAACRAIRRRTGQKSQGS